MSTSSRQNTRFSTLNVFKFGSSPKPPPPPPKDSYYQPNHSFASLAHTLSPETCIAPLPTPSGQPTTPVSAGYAHSARSPSPSPSYAPSCATSSYASSSLMAQSTTSLSTTAESTTGKKGFFKSFSLSKKLKTPKSQTMDLPGDQPEPDDSISLPWNFQVRPLASSCLSTTLTDAHPRSTMYTSTKRTSSFVCYPLSCRRRSRARAFQVCRPSSDLGRFSRSDGVL